MVPDFVHSCCSCIGPAARPDRVLLLQVLQLVLHVLPIIRFGQRPSKVAFLAWHAWRDASRGRWPAEFPEGGRNEYDLATIGHWLENFVKRFFGFAQFKRSALPNGPKVSGGGAVSPRGDWRAPSDAVADVWVEELRSGLPPLG